MKFNRTQNAARNIRFGLFQRFYQLLVPFAMKTAMIHWLGVEYLGLDGLFTSILSVLNLAELGVGSAMVYSMYKPVAEDDKTQISALMKLYKIYYRIIGIIVLVSGIILCPFVPNLIKGDVPNGINVYILFLLNLAATVLSYWLFAYKNCLLQAYQRSDVSSKVTMAVNTLRYLAQFVTLFLFHNYYLYLIITLASQALINIMTAMVVSKMYPNLAPNGELDIQERKTINYRIRDLFTAKIGSVVVNSVDTLVISAFLGLTVLAIYQNYYFIITAILSIVSIFIYSCTSGIGNSLIVETKEKNYTDFNTFTFLIACVAIICTSCLICLYQPFMELWVGIDLMFGMSAVICFSIYFFIYLINTLLNAYKDAAGIWHEDRFRPLITAIANLVMNLIMVQFWGIYGILLSTVLSMLFVGMPWLIHNLFSTMFEKEKMWSYVFSLLRYSISAILIVAICFFVCNFVPLSGIPLLAVRLFICVMLSSGLLIVFYRKTEQFEDAIFVVDRITKHKLHFHSLFYGK